MLKSGALAISRESWKDEIPLVCSMPPWKFASLAKKSDQSRRSPVISFSYNEFHFECNFYSYISKASYRPRKEKEEWNEFPFKI